MFSNTRKNRVKLLLWDGTGVWLAQRRLHQGSFSWYTPKAQTQKGASPNASHTLSHEQWQGSLTASTGRDWRPVPMSTPTGQWGDARAITREIGHDFERGIERRIRRKTAPKMHQKYIPESVSEWAFQRGLSSKIL